MNKSFTKAVVAGSILASTVGNTGMALAYSGETDYPENQLSGLVATMIDVRHSKMTVYLRDADYDYAILKGVMFFEGDVEDSELLMAYPGDEYGLKQYYRFDSESEDWEDRETGQELTVELTENLAENTSRILGFTDYFWVDSINREMNIRWGRINYGECINSGVFRENDEAICRAEVWDDGAIHYQPYIGWERLSSGDASDEEAGTIKVYKGNEWVAEGASDGEGDDDEGGDGAGEGGGEETPGGGGGEVESGGGEEPEPTEKEVEIRYIDREIIREVPVEIIKTVEVDKIKTVEVEVPVEKVKTVEVQVPVEKTVVETKEVVKEVPVVTATVAQAVELGEVAQSERVVEPSDEMAEMSEDDEDEELLEESEDELEEEVTVETVELPELGKEAPTDTNSGWRIAALVAGIISAVALLMVGIIVRKKKANS